MARKVSLILSHWYHLIEGLQDSTQRFYTTLEQAIGARQIEKLDLSRIDYREGGILSDKREYFRVRRKDHIFDICAAPFGNSFFVSWWLGESLGPLWTLILKIPILGVLLLKLIRPETYYRFDTALMFQQSVHSAVLEVIDQTTNAKGIRSLTESERKPILSSLFKN
jgi:hypothetical protein